VKKTHAMERIIKVLNNLDKTFLLFSNKFYKKGGIVGLFQEKGGKSRKRRARLKACKQGYVCHIRAKLHSMSFLNFSTMFSLNQWFG